MTKPSNVPGPSIILKQGPDFPTAAKVLDHIRNVYSRDRAVSPAVMDALEQTLKKWQDWRPGDPECSSTWLAECSSHNLAALAWIASDMEIRGTATTANIAALRTTAADMRRFLKETAPVVEVIVPPQQDSYPSAALLRSAPKPFTPAITATVMLEINGEAHAITMPADHHTAATVIQELQNVILQVGTLASVPVGTTAQTTAQYELDHGLSLLRALSVLNDGGPIEDKHRLDYQPFTAAARVERARERDMQIGGR